MLADQCSKLHMSRRASQWGDGVPLEVQHLGVGSVASVAGPGPVPADSLRADPDGTPNAHRAPVVEALPHHDGTGTGVLDDLIGPAGGGGDARGGGIIPCGRRRDVHEVVGSQRGGSGMYYV